MSEASLRVVLRGPNAGVEGASEALRRFADAAALPADLLNDLLVIVDEVISNWLKYGRAGPRAPEMEIQASVAAERLTLRFSDTGPAFDPLFAPSPDLDVPLDERPVGGLGLYLVRALTDSQHYARLDGRNVLDLSRSIEGRRRRR